jgi:hypothetical protein
MTRDNLQFEIAVLMSLLLHAMTFGCWEYRDVLAESPLFKPIARVVSAAFALPKYTQTKPAPQTITFVEAPERQPAQPEREPPRQFMETDNSQVTGEQPKDAKYYSDRSTVAANPVNPTGKTGDTPYLDGKETRVMSTEDVVPNPGAPSAPVAPPAPASPPPLPPTVAANSQPAAAARPLPPPPPATAAADHPKEVAAQGLNAAEEKKLVMGPREVEPVQQSTAAGDSASATPSSASSSAAYRRPALGSAGGPSGREIAAVRSRLVASGVNRIGVAAFNVEESPFGTYDKQLIRAVQSRWYALIDKNQLYERAGEVTLHFQLLDDGTVQGMEIKENTAGQILALFCQKAIVDSAPFEPLPEELRMLVGKEPREVNFTFYY